jgi:hypothetical protein
MLRYSIRMIFGKANGGNWSSVARAMAAMDTLQRILRVVVFLASAALLAWALHEVIRLVQ